MHDAKSSIVAKAFVCESRLLSVRFVVVVWNFRSPLRSLSLALLSRNRYLPFYQHTFSLPLSPLSFKHLGLSVHLTHLRNSLYL